MRILIIEDDMITAADLTATLEEGGHEVVAVADTGRGAVASAERNLGRRAEMVGAIAYVPKPTRASDVLKLVDRLESIPSSFC